VTIRRNIGEGYSVTKKVGDGLRHPCVSKLMGNIVRETPPLFRCFFLQDDLETEIQSRDLQNPPAWMLRQFDL
jgi:hypothetical protein